MAVMRGVISRFCPILPEVERQIRGNAWVRGWTLALSSTPAKFMAGTFWCMERKVPWVGQGLPAPRGSDGSAWLGAGMRTAISPP